MSEQTEHALLSRKMEVSVCWKCHKRIHFPPSLEELKKQPIDDKIALDIFRSKFTMYEMGNVLNPFQGEQHDAASR